ncbi:MAG TPA: RNA 2',3'-cyclic phosphodiesterase [Verrucomicrobiae bacterium]|nr:RNA 2',3'-cyclic phosphodiesterase [Verrucomicrobiae bacterium]
MENGEKPKAFRLFVAISPPDDVKSEIEKIQRQLRAALPGNFIRWTKPAQFHLTLKFLGDIAESRIAELIEVLRVTCGRCAPLRLRAEQVGFFPGARAPRVLWGGVHDEQGLLPRFQQAVETNTIEFTMEKYGSAAGKSASRREKFTGHITLGRIPNINRSQSETVAEAVSGVAREFFGEWIADTVELIRSELSSAGSRYTTLAAIPLSGNA